MSLQHLPPEPWRRDASDLACAIRRRAISTRAVLDRCAAVNPAIKAVVLALEATEVIEAACPMPTPIDPRGVA